MGIFCNFVFGALIDRRSKKLFILILTWIIQRKFPNWTASSLCGTESHLTDGILRLQSCTCSILLTLTPEISVVFLKLLFQKTEMKTWCGLRADARHASAPSRWTCSCPALTVSWLSSPSQTTSVQKTEAHTGLRITVDHWMSNRGKVWLRPGGAAAGGVCWTRCYLRHAIRQGMSHLALLHSETEDKKSNAI